MKTRTINLRKKKKSKVSGKAAPAKAPEPLITIERPVYHIGRGGSFYRTNFKDLDGKSRCVDIPRHFFGQPKEAIKLLLNGHAKLPKAQEDQKKALDDAVDAIINSKTLRITDRVGWGNQDGDNTSFVFFGKTFGAKHDALTLDDDSTRNSALGRKAGTIEGWRNGLEEPCRHADHLILAIGIAASGPLYGIIGDPEPAIYHFQGARKPVGDGRVWKSSSGKTLSARCAQSIFGSCSRTDLFGFNMTELALEETCFSCNHLVVVLDEEGAAGAGGSGKLIDPRSLAYRIIGGQGKRRSRSYSVSQGLSNRSWVVPVITTAEDELDAKGLVRKEGAQARMVAVPFPPSWQGGMFCAADNPEERNRLAKLVETTIDTNYGKIIPRYLKHLVSERMELQAEIPEMRDEFVRNVGAADDSWEKRFAEKFGMVLAGCLLLARYGIAPWTEKRAREAVTNLYNASRSMTVSVPEATSALLKKLERQVKDKTLFPRVPKGAELSPGQRRTMRGLVREVGGKKNVAALTFSRFEKLVKPSAASMEVLKALDAQSRLVKDPDGKTLTRQVLVKGLTGKRARYVCIKGLIAKSAKSGSNKGMPKSGVR